jgi:hypothetical protein
LDPDTTDKLVVAPLLARLPVPSALRALCASVVNRDMILFSAP